MRPFGFGDCTQLLQQRQIVKCHFTQPKRQIRDQVARFDNLQHRQFGDWRERMRREL